MKALTLAWKVGGHKFQQTVNGEKEITIGRDAKCDIVLDNLYVSGVHAAVSCRNSGLELHVLSRTNPVVVNYLELEEQGSTVSLHPGDVFLVGQVEILVADAQSDNSSVNGKGSLFGNCPACGAVLDGIFSECLQCRSASAAQRNRQGPTHITIPVTTKPFPK